MTKKTTNKSATRFDILIGNQVRVRRLELGLTQEGLGEKLGVTFQQIQKYEKGTNRIGSGRLYEIAELMEVSPSYFFPEDGRVKREPSIRDIALASADGMALNQAFIKLEDKDIRRSIVRLVEKIVGSETARD